MRIVINLQKEQLTVFLIAVLIVLGVSVAIAYQSGSSPSVMGHDWGEIECAGCVSSANVQDNSLTGADINESALNCTQITGGTGLCDGTDNGLPGVYACIRVTSSTTCNDICQARGLTCTHSFFNQYGDPGMGQMSGNAWWQYCNFRCQREGEVSPEEALLCNCA